MQMRATCARETGSGRHIAAKLRASIFIYLPWNPLPAWDKGVVAPIYVGGEFVERWNVCLVEWWLCFNLARMLKKTGSRVKPVMTRFYGLMWFVSGFSGSFKRLDHGSITPPDRYRSGGDPDRP